MNRKTPEEWAREIDDQLWKQDLMPFGPHDPEDLRVKFLAGVLRSVLADADSAQRRMYTGVLCPPNLEGAALSWNELLHEARERGREEALNEGEASEGGKRTSSH